MAWLRAVPEKEHVHALPQSIIDNAVSTRWGYAVSTRWGYAVSTRWGYAASESHRSGLTSFFVIPASSKARSTGRRLRSRSWRLMSSNCSRVKLESKSSPPYKASTSRVAWVSKRRGRSVKNVQYPWLVSLLTTETSVQDFGPEMAAGVACNYELNHTTGTSVGAALNRQQPLVHNRCAYTFKLEDRVT